jgi:hypothetical protein
MLPIAYYGAVVVVLCNGIMRDDAMRCDAMKWVMRRTVLTLMSFSGIESGELRCERPKQ